MSINEQEVLQEYIVPILHYRKDIQTQTAVLQKLFGTAFFVNEFGIFLTAAHVLKDAEAYLEKNPGGVGLNIRDPADKRRSLMGQFSHYEYAPNSYDVAIGRINIPTIKRFSYQPMRGANSMGHQVASYGYPETALHITAEQYNVNLRCLRGHVQRHLKADEVSLCSPHPPGFELSFPVPVGMSGAPLISLGSYNKGFNFIGLCTGVIEAGFLRHTHTEVTDGGEKFTEEVRQIEAYGLALSLENILDWRPTFLDGQSLDDILSGK